MAHDTPSNSIGFLQMFCCIYRDWSFLKSAIFTLLVPARSRWRLPSRPCDASSRLCLIRRSFIVVFNDVTTGPGHQPRCYGTRPVSSPTVPWDLTRPLRVAPPSIQGGSTQRLFFFFFFRERMKWSRCSREQCGGGLSSLRSLPLGNLDVFHVRWGTTHFSRILSLCLRWPEGVTPLKPEDLFQNRACLSYSWVPSYDLSLSPPPPPPPLPCSNPLAVKTEQGLLLPFIYSFTRAKAVCPVHWSVAM